jgi:tetratricopeptide (TPR) repeat protein
MKKYLIILAACLLATAAWSQSGRKEKKQKEAEALMAIAQDSLNARSTNYAYILELLDKAEKNDKNNPEISNMQGDVYRRMGEGGKAVQAYSEALKKDNNYARASYNIGKIYLTQQNTEMFLKYFNEALTKDAAYAPALYELYYYYYFRDVNLAKEYLDKYIASTGPSVENDYMMADLLYVSSKHQQAIDAAKQLLQKEGNAAQPRLLKLIAYSYESLGDSTSALNYISQYFQKAPDSSFVAKDFALRANLLQKIAGRETEAVADLQKAIELDTLADNKAGYMKDLAAIYKQKGDRSQEAHWLGKLYQVKADPSNLDLYYWGLAHYAAREYPQADSVFGLYTEKYPDHIHGFYWRAKSTALIDTAMEKGMAVPHYQKVIELAAADSLKNKSLLIQAYGYVGAYKANMEKDFEEALVNFNKILELDPANADALRYSEILKKWVRAKQENTDSKSGTESRPEIEN